MALPWHIPLKYAPRFEEKHESPQPTLTKHYCHLDLHGRPSDEIKTEFMCEIGVNNREPEDIQSLIIAGMSIARLNLRDLDAEVGCELIQSLRGAVCCYSFEANYVNPLPVVVDIRGPHIVTGYLRDAPTVEITDNCIVRLTTDSDWLNYGTAECLYFSYDSIDELNPGDLIYIDSITPGKVQLTVRAVGDDSIECTADVGGKIGSKMAVHIVHILRNTGTRKALRAGDNIECDDDKAAISYNFEKMDEQIAWAVSMEIDGVIAPNIRHLNDILGVKQFLSGKGQHILVFASIDTATGLDNIDEILPECDGIYLDRTSLGAHLPIEKVSIAQKVIMAKCKNNGKPCICKAVINEQIPTLCVSDIANLIMDGADVLALDLDYASPLKKMTKDVIRMAEHCLAAAGVICRHAERTIWYPKMYGNLKLVPCPVDEPYLTVCISAVELALRSQAVAIICLTRYGRTPKALCRLRHNCPIVAVTRNCRTARQLRFWRGIRVVHFVEPSTDGLIAEIEARVCVAVDYCKKMRLMRAGDLYLTLTGTRRNSKYCEMIRILYASSRETVV